MVIKVILIKTSTGKECYYSCYLGIGESGNWYYLLESVSVINILNMSVLVPVIGPGSLAKSNPALDVMRQNGRTHFGSSDMFLTPQHYVNTGPL